jgi:hypothetical protein
VAWLAWLAWLAWHTTEMVGEWIDFVVLDDVNELNEYSIRYSKHFELGVTCLSCFPCCENYYHTNAPRTLVTMTAFVLV